MSNVSCKETSNIIFGYDWYGSSNTQPEDEDGSRRARGLELINWKSDKSVETSKWWVAYQAQVKQNIKITAQMPGIELIVVVGIDGGKISQLEARELPRLAHEAQEDLDGKGVVTTIEVKQFKSLDRFIAHLTPEAHLQPQLHWCPGWLISR